jgi:hypothetical protein
LLLYRYGILRWLRLRRDVIFRWLRLRRDVSNPKLFSRVPEVHIVLSTIRFPPAFQIGDFMVL